MCGGGSGQQIFDDVAGTAAGVLTGNPFIGSAVSGGQSSAQGNSGGKILGAAVGGGLGAAGASALGAGDLIGGGALATDAGATALTSAGDAGVLASGGAAGLAAQAGADGALAGSGAVATPLAGATSALGPTTAATQLGLTAGGGGDAALTGGAAAGDAALSAASAPPLPDPTSLAPNVATPATPSFGEQFGKYITSPQGAIQAGLAGASLYAGTRTPQLPGALQTVQNNNTALQSQATGIINSGGTSNPNWASQKASIDATINQQIQQQTQQILQNAANSGQGGAQSMVVQQALSQMQQQANVQRQQLYMQALNTYVQQATSILTGGNQALAAVGNAQINQSNQAQQIAAELAMQAARLGTNATSNVPTQGYTAE